jgi:hypothetical protein
VRAGKVPGLLYIFFRSLWAGGRKWRERREKRLDRGSGTEEGSWLAEFLW